MADDRPNAGIAAGGVARRARVSLAAAYAGLFLPLGIFMPYFPLWLAAAGLTPAEIGVTLAVPQVARLAATPVLGLISDRLGRPKAVIAMLAAVTVAFMAVLSEMRSALAIAVVCGLAAMAWNPCFALLDAYASRQARARLVDYGRSRLWGSGSFILANVLGGLVVAQTGATSVVLLMLAGNAAFLAASLVLPELPRAAPPPRDTGLPRARARAALVAGVVAAALVQASHGTLYAFVSLHWDRTGLDSPLIGLLWAVGVVAEMAVFRVGTRLTSRFGAPALLAAGGLAAAVRFTALAFDPPLPALFAVQLLHGLTFGATYLGMVHLVAHSAGEHRAAGAQALAAWTVSLALTGASLVSGPLWALFGARSFLLSALLGLAGAGAALACARLQPHRPAGAGITVEPS